MVEMMRDQIARSIEIRLEDLQKQPFSIFQIAGSFDNDFGKVEKIVNELNWALAA